MSIDSTSECVMESGMPFAAAPPLDLAGKAHRQLERTAASATVWTLVAYGATQVLRMGNNIVLTRLLLPEYFGLMTLMTTFVTGMILLSDVGLLPSVVSSPRGDEPLFLNTAFTIQTIRGLVLWLIALVLAYPLAVLYHDHRIVLLMPAIGFTLVLNGLASTNLLSAARHIGVRRLLTIDLLTQAFGIVVMLVWAWVHPTVWALVGGTLASNGAKTVLSHLPFVLPGQRNRFEWDATCARSLVNIGKWIIVGTAFYFFAAQADRLLLGRLIPFALLGIYNIAFTIADIPRQVILQFCNRVGFPFAAKLACLPRHEFRARLLAYRFYVLCAGALILATVVLAGGPFILHVYDVRYQAASWMVPILALGLWHTLLYSTTGSVMLSIGKPRYNTVGTGLFCAVMFLMLPLAFHWYGLRGAIVTVAAGDLPCYLVLAWGAAHERISFWRQDGLATCIFAAFLALGLMVRHLLV